MRLGSWGSRYLGWRLGRPGFIELSLMDDVDPLDAALARGFRRAELGQPSNPDRAGRRPRYEIGSELGRGGMGVVFRAQDRELGRTVALKVLRSDAAIRGIRPERFVEEARIASQLEHPSILPVYDFGVWSGGEPFFTMRLVLGTSLAERLKAGPLEPSERLRVFSRILEAVAYAHQRGVIHRDLKPGNVLLGSFGEVFVMDWGLAKVLERSEPTPENESTPGSSPPAWASESGSVMGTYAYMPPEQARGDIASIDARSDVFALGAILLELWTGSPPYSSSDRTTLKSLAEGANLEEAFARLEASAADPALGAIIRGTLAADPSARLPNAGSVLDQFRAWERGEARRLEAAEIAAAEARERARQDRRARRLVTALALAVVLGLGSVAWVGFQWREARLADQVATEHAANSELDRALALAAATTRATAVESLEQAVHQARAALSSLERAELASDRTARARSILAGLEASLATARASRTQDQRDHHLAVALERAQTALDSGDQVIQSAADRRKEARHRYEVAFAAYGVDVLGSSVASSAAELRKSSIALEIAMSVSHWATILEKGNETREAARILIAIADALDPAPDRMQLRAMIATRSVDVSEVLRLARDSRAMRGAPFLARIVGNILVSCAHDRDALDLLREVSRHHPSDFQIQFQLFVVEKDAPDRDLTAAIRQGWLVRALRPDHLGILHDLAGLESQAGHAKIALELYEELVRIRPKDAHSVVHVAQEHFTRQRFAEALNWAKRALELDRGQAGAWSILGASHWKLGRLDDAEAAFKSLAELLPRLAVGPNNLGLLLFERERYREAADAFATALAREPNLPDRGNLHYDLGQALRLSGDSSAALPHYEAAVEFEPTDPANHDALVVALLASGNFPPAAQRATTAAALFPTRYLSQFNAAIAHLATSSESVAVADLKRAQAIDPDNFVPVLLEIHVRCLAKDPAARSPEAARAGIAKLEALSPHPAHVATARTMLHIVQGEFEAALGSVELVKDELDDPELVGLLYARIAYGLGRTERAEESFSEAEAVRSTRTDWHLQRLREILTESLSQK